MLTCHSAWNRRYHPFLCCACKRGDAGNPGHKCVPFTNNQYRQKYEKSLERWEKRDIISAMTTRQYTIEMHKDWCDQHNAGITHVGVVPNSYNIDNICFDVFHGRGNVVKIVLSYLRNLLEGNVDALENFCEFFLSLRYWSDYEVTPWLLNKPNSRLKGRHTKEFTRKIQLVIRKIKQTLIGNEVDYLCSALAMYSKINLFLGYTIIDNWIRGNKFIGSNEFSSTTNKRDVAYGMIEKYKDIAKKFYYAGMKSFLTKSIPGDGETFYVHVVTCYIPVVAKRTYDEHGLGVGIFTMEGFESVNYSSKQFIRNKSNRKHNICAQSLKGLVLQYKSLSFDCIAEVEKRKELEQKELCMEGESVGTSTSSISSRGSRLRRNLQVEDDHITDAFIEHEIEEARDINDIFVSI